MTQPELENQEVPQLGDIVVNHEGKSPQVVGSSFMPLEIARTLVAEGHARIIQREHRRWEGLSEVEILDILRWKAASLAESQDTA